MPPRVAPGSRGEAGAPRPPEPWGPPAPIDVQFGSSPSKSRAPGGRRDGAEARRGRYWELCGRIGLPEAVARRKSEMVEVEETTMEVEETMMAAKARAGALMMGAEDMRGYLELCRRAGELEAQGPPGEAGPEDLRPGSDSDAALCLAQQILREATPTKMAPAVAMPIGRRGCDLQQPDPEVSPHRARISPHGSPTTAAQTPRSTGKRRQVLGSTLTAASPQRRLNQRWIDPLVQPRLGKRQAAT